MRKIFIIAITLIPLLGVAQKIVKTADGNFRQVKTERVSRKFQDTITNQTVIMNDGKKYEIFKSKNNKLYIWKVSKKGNIYKYYLKLN